MTFQNQTLWDSIGWVTPAAVGAALAAKDDRRVVLVTGKGSHQATVQEICQFGRLGLCLLCAHPDILCNGVPLRRFTDLPEARDLRRIGLPYRGCDRHVRGAAHGRTVACRH
ncbi:thiamine pyrophosphate-dependent enzyme [Streptomyces sp. Ag109_O5-10]|uniref:thiamine pyrophosphate-dependent enzyme n=1 Tax=Streptomyces sp. Ag109_O5-10 TaxID=1855349 RepID=UPI002737D7CC|nr:thiamine pyrophosphate-dependent enzyme [Streptomyces sp. Ag109_O5-10]